MSFLTLDMEKKQAIIFCIVCQFTLIRHTVIALFPLWRQTTGVYP